MKQSYEGEQVLTPLARRSLEWSLAASVPIGSGQPHGVVEKLGGSPTRSDVVRGCGSSLVLVATTAMPIAQARVRLRAASSLSYTEGN
jgi:hypothetical protein